MSKKTFNIEVTMENEDIKSFCEALRSIEKQYNERYRFRLTSIEDRLLEELQNCIQYEGYRVCVFVSNAKEKYDIEEIVFNLLKDIDFSLDQSDEHCRKYGYFFDNKSRFRVFDAQYGIESRAKGMRFNTVICYNVDPDTLFLLRSRYLTLPHPVGEYRDCLVYTR